MQNALRANAKQKPQPYSPSPFLLHASYSEDRIDKKTNALHRHHE